MRAAISALLLFTLSVGAAGAQAQRGRPDARAHFERGVRHAGAGEWEQALEAFEASEALRARARTLFNIAVALDRLERGRECLAAVERLLARGDVDPADRAAAEELRVRWRGRLAESRPPTPPVSEARPASVRMRPLDEATIRLVALRGADSAGSGTVVPRATHGSGVVVHRDGWVLTARHVVEGADRLVALLPGDVRAIPARVAWLDPDRDLAFVRLGEPSSHVVPLVAPPALEAGQGVDASGYPLDASERWPNATSGQVGRLLNDGRVQLSIGLNPGNSGGPVAVDGALIGIVSQGGDPGRGVQSVVVMEPVGPMVERLATLLASPAFPDIEEDPSDAVFIELIGGIEAPPVARRLARLRVAAALPTPDARGALWALEAAALRWTILQGAHAPTAMSLPPDLRALFDEATSLASTLSQGVVAAPLLSARYAALGSLTAPIRQGGWDCTVTGECNPRADEAVPLGAGWLFDFAIAGGIAVDDDQRASFAEGAMFSVLGLFHLGDFGDLDPVRFNILVGAEASAGSWRSAAAASINADVGARLALGSPRVAVAFQLMYTPGVVVAENRLTFAYIAYRATVALQLGAFGLGLSWRELGRGADDTQRSLEFFLSWGFR